MNRSTLSEFLAVPPHRACCAWRNWNFRKEKIPLSLEPWLSRMILLESDSMGPVSLAEIETSKKDTWSIGHCHRSRSIRLWKGDCMQNCIKPMQIAELQNRLNCKSRTNIKNSTKQKKWGIWNWPGSNIIEQYQGPSIDEIESELNGTWRNREK